MWTDPDDLLPTDRFLLDKDFAKMGAYDADAQAYLAAKVESASKAACLLHSQERSRQDSPYVEPIPPQSTEPDVGAPIDTEGSNRYRRQRHKR